MRNLKGCFLRRTTVGLLSLAALALPGRATATVPDPGPEKSRIPFTTRYDSVLHGGIVRAANAAITCRGAGSAEKAGCSAARSGATASNGDFDMFYTDVDRDPNTYNSTRAEVRVPEGARVTYARLYWGGNLRAGEQKPPRDNGRVLVAEPGGAYKQLLADEPAGHLTANGADAFQASADVTDLVRAGGSGLYTVAQVNVARGRTAAGAWGGWTLVVAYEKKSEPLRHLFLQDGFGTFTARHPGQAFHQRTAPAAGTGGYVGLVAYNGDRGRTGDSLTVATGRGRPVALSDRANPARDVLNSTISEPGTRPSRRVPAHANTLGYDSDVFPLGRAVRSGARALDLRLTSPEDAAWTGVLFGAVDVRS
ncbi:DUF3344 domain-containing protein [Streptomyces kunmingensis]|uniref:DUF3344 domain-containing protein n=1 Tax=Streptomyces kunmingensis TaxID=68225 RepID=A0ABU6C516_9ACTN|nr:DUF3344 domain-containing protein [Streptomyces kunmingensis]MEB3959653.1 DUF3344 domain-containing protein [Streptomyces kunmingensis]